MQPFKIWCETEKRKESRPPKDGATGDQMAVRSKTYCH